MVDARKWLLAKALPKIYGEKMQHVGSDSDEPINIVIKRFVVEE